MTDKLNALIISKISQMIEAMGSVNFPNKLDEFLACLVAYDASAIFVYSKQQAPILLHDGFREHGTKSALKNYLKGSYLLSSVYHFAVTTSQEGLFRFRDLPRNDFFNRDYFNSWAVHPCMSSDSGSQVEEVTFFKTLACGAKAAYSLMRGNAKAPFDENDISLLKQFESMICNAIERNWYNLKLTPSEKTMEKRTWNTGDMERSFETFVSGKLTSREYMVVRLLLLGHSVTAVAKELAIAPGTVKNHKKNIFLKLKISSMSELFSLFIRHILP